MAKAPKIFQPVIATGNRLRTGDVVFRTSAGLWSNDVSKALVAETQEAAAQLQGAVDADHAANIVVDQALIPVTREDGVVRPVALRERIRAQGPTIAMPDVAAGTGASSAAAPVPDSSQGVFDVSL